MVPIFSFLISSGSKKEPRFECLSEARASHSHKTSTEVSSPVHFLQMGLLLSPITYKCHLRVLWSLRRLMTTLDWVLLKDNNRALVAKLVLENKPRTCLCVPQGPRHITKCWLSSQCIILLLMFCLETPKKGSGPTNFWTELSLAYLSAILFPCTPACPGKCGTEIMHPVYKQDLKVWDWRLLWWWIVLLCFSVF